MTEFLIVLNKDDDSISIIDVAQGHEIKRIPCDHNPHEIVVMQTKPKAYITCSGGNTINILDLNTFEIVKRIEHPDFKFPHGVGLTQDEATLFMASTRSGRVFLIDTSTDEVEKVLLTHQASTHMISFSPDGSTVYVANIASNNITVIDVKSESIITHIPVGRGPEGVAVNPKGNHLYVANQHDNDITVLDAITYEVLYRRKIGALPIRLVFSPDGKYALIPNRESGDLSIIETEHTSLGEARPWEVKRIRVGVWPGGVVFNHDGSKAYVANNKDNDISIIDISTLKETGRIDAGTHPDGIAYYINK